MNEWNWMNEWMCKNHDDALHRSFRIKYVNLKIWLARKKMPPNKTPDIWSIIFKQDWISPSFFSILDHFDKETKMLWLEIKTPVLYVTYLKKVKHCTNWCEGRYCIHSDEFRVWIKTKYLTFFFFVLFLFCFHLDLQWSDNN